MCVVSAAAISTIVCDVENKVNLVLECVKDKKHSVKTIVVMQTPSDDLVSRGHQAGIQIISLQEMEVSRRFLQPVSCHDLIGLLPFFCLLIFLGNVFVLWCFTHDCYCWSFFFDVACFISLFCFFVP